MSVSNNHGEMAMALGSFCAIPVNCVLFITGTGFRGWCVIIVTVHADTFIDTIVTEKSRPSLISTLDLISLLVPLTIATIIQRVHSNILVNEPISPSIISAMVMRAQTNLNLIRIDSNSNSSSARARVWNSKK